MNELVIHLIYISKIPLFAAIQIVSFDGLIERGNVASEKNLEHLYMVI